MTPQIKSSTLYVGNLPVDATRTEVEEIFGEAGPIKKCFVLKAKGDASSYAFVTYALPEDTDTAAAELKHSTIRGNQLNVSISNRKQKLRRGRDAPDQNAASEQQKPGKRPPPKKQKSEDGAAVEAAPQGSPPKKRKTLPAKEDAHAAGPSKKGRLIVRNLSFKVTEESFRKHFESAGTVTEINLLKKPNGLLVGCGFVQYKHEKHAEEAIKKFNTKPFLGRPIVIDWAVDKTRYEAAQKPAQSSNKAKKRSLDEDEENEEEDEGSEQDEEESNDDGDSISNSSPNKSSARLNDSVETDEEDEASEEEGNDDEEVDEDDEDEDDSDAESEENDAEDASADEDFDDDSEEDDVNESDDDTTANKKTTKRKKELKSDVGEGTTLFLKNMSFDTNQDTLKELFSQYGRVKYAVICVDPLTEHPRGTAFVQFKSAEEAEAAQAAAADPDNAALFTLDDRRIEVLAAVNKDELRRKSQLAKERSTEGKDKRNLYLAREGLVREGSRAAEAVSRADLNKRVGLEKWKTKMLRNLGMFVSPVRLCVHNVPADWDDAALRRTFQQHAPAGAQVTEARVMRDRRDVTSHPRGQSKEYGFVSFTQHEASLAALRNINNNPEIFTNNRRPIVEFAVENRAALDARRKREEKSRQMNQAPPPPAAGGGRRRGASKTAAPAPAAVAQPARPAHAGMAADPTNKRLPKLKARAGAQENAKAITRKMLKTDKKGRRERAGQKKDVVQDWERSAAETKTKPSRREKKAALKGTRGQERPEDAKFTSLVDKYRQKLAATPAAASRWFQ